MRARCFLKHPAFWLLVVWVVAYVFLFLLTLGAFN